MMVLARIVFWALLLAGAWYLYKLLLKHPRFKMQENDDSSFSCPYCGEKIIYRDRVEGDRYLCFACQRTVIRGRKPTAEERAQIRAEEEDCAAVEQYLNSGTLFEDVLDPIHYPDAFIVRIAAWSDRVDPEVITRKTDPYDPLDAKLETIKLDPVPLPHRIETKAGVVAFHRAVIAYARRFYSDTWNADFSSSHLRIGLTRK